jgi:hypothetical protein
MHVHVIRGKSLKHVGTVQYYELKVLHIFRTIESTTVGIVQVVYRETRQVEIRVLADKVRSCPRRSQFSSLSS